MIEWRQTAGGVEIAEHEDMTAIAYTYEARVEVFKAGRMIDGSSNLSHETAKQWFDREYCKPRYTVDKFEDCGEVYWSLDGKRVAMVGRYSEGWRALDGRGWLTTSPVQSDVVNEAIRYVTFVVRKDS